MVGFLFGFANDKLIKDIWESSSPVVKVVECAVRG